MNRRQVLLATAILCTLSTPAVAQSDSQLWLTLAAKADLTNKLSVQDELVARFSDDRGGLYEIENALLLSYKISRTLSAAAGYVHNPTYAAGAFALMERRAREQVVIDNFAKLGSASLSARLRLEQRWRDGVSGTAWRARPYVKLGVPLGDKAAPTVNITAETFINLNTTSFQGVDGLERLRSAVAVSFPLRQAIKLDVGYLNQHRFVRNGPDSDDHALTITLGFAF